MHAKSETWKEWQITQTYPRAVMLSYTCIYAYFVMHIILVIIVGETGVVYKGYLNEPTGRELVAIKTGNGMQYCTFCV